MNKLQKIKKLEEQIFLHRNAYYNKEQIISDSEFDLLVDELDGLDEKNLAITSIGYPALEDNGWKKAKHKIHMGSLNKVSNTCDMSNWVNEHIKNEVFIIDKIDGLSIEILYEDGKLTQCITRGNGVEGDCITSNVIKMNGVKKELPLLFSGSLRGEIIMTRKNYNEKFSDKSNGRNQAAGISRRLDGQGCEFLDVIFYQVIGNAELLSEVEIIEYISKNLGLNVPNWYVYSENYIYNIEKTYKNYENHIRSQLDYEIDGLVIKVNNIEEQIEWGENNLRPKGSIAYKFSAENAETKINNIIIQLGKSGRITPVAEFDAINLAGAEITKASLHNFKRIKDLKVDIGATVMVSRRGDIIPQVEKVIKNTGTIFKEPLKCPVCNGQVEMQGEYMVCISTDLCPGQISGRISTWISTLNILEWGDKLIDRLVDEGKVNDTFDLYKLKVDDLANIDRMGIKSAKKCNDLLWAKTELPLEIFLGGLSIPTAAVSTFKIIIESGYNTLEKILLINKEQLLKINGIGEIKAEFIFNGLERNKKLIHNLLGIGLSIKEQKNGKLSGMKIAITGSTIRKRSELQDIITSAGGIYKSSISNDVSHLVIADINSASVKAKNAKSMGVKLISENSLMEMI